MQDLRTLLLVGVLVAPDEKGVLLLDKFDLVRGEAREGHGDTVVVFAGPLDVVGWPARRGFVGGEEVRVAFRGRHEHALREIWLRQLRTSGTGVLHLSRFVMINPRRARSSNAGRS